VFFDAPHVKDGQIVAHTPREDRVTEVVELVEAAIGYRDEQAAAAAGGARLVFATSDREGFESVATKRGAVFA
jgi:hypothetical protein